MPEIYTVKLVKQMLVCLDMSGQRERIVCRGVAIGQEKKPGRSRGLL